MCEQSAMWQNLLASKRLSWHVRLAKLYDTDLFDSRHMLRQGEIQKKSCDATETQREQINKNINASFECMNNEN